jgi:hypothetical protein
MKEFMKEDAAKIAFLQCDVMEIFHKGDINAARRHRESTHTSALFRTFFGKCNVERVR